MSKHARLTLAHRVVSENMTLAGYTQTGIGLAIGVHQSTVSGDLARCGSGTYCAKRAHAPRRHARSCPHDRALAGPVH